jgi:hypothetical protein
VDDQGRDQEASERLESTRRRDHGKQVTEESDGVEPVSPDPLGAAV